MSDPTLVTAGEERDPAVIEQIRRQYRLDQPLIGTAPARWGSPGMGQKFNAFKPIRPPAGKRRSRGGFLSAVPGATDRGYRHFAEAACVGMNNRLQLKHARKGCLYSLH